MTFSFRRCLAVSVGSLLLGSLLLTAPSGAAVPVEQSCTGMRSAGSLEILGPGLFAGVVISADGSVRASATFGARPEDGRTVLQINDREGVVVRELETPPGRAEVVALNRDGSRLLVNATWRLDGSTPDPNRLQVFLVDTETSAIEPVSAAVGAVEAMATSQSAEGDRIVFTTFDPDRNGQVHLWDQGTVTSLPITRAATAGTLEYPSINPILSGDGSVVLYRQDVGGRLTQRRLIIGTSDDRALPGFGDRVAALSADGSIVVGASPVIGGPAAVLVWDPDRGTTTVEGVSVGTSSIVLTPDGRQAVFGSHRQVFDPVSGDVVSAATDVWSLDTATADLSPVATIEGLNSFVSLAGISADGRTIRATISRRWIRTGPIDRGSVERGTLPGGADLVEIDLDGEPFCQTITGYSGSLDDQLVRLYAAYFGRQPDVGGLQFWRGERAEGRSIASVSEAFAQSQEFVATYGELGNEAFIDLVYRNVLGRDADAGGRAFWLDQLGQGRSRGSVMALFSDSPEYVDATDTLAPESATAASIRRLYAALLGRAPDEAGLAFWVGEAERGVPHEEIVLRITNTTEFRVRYPGAGDSHFSMVSLGFGNLLGRDIDVRFTDPRFIELLESSGVTSVQSLLGIVDSPEAIARTSSTPVGG